ncbi:unnamed protein product [Withania somnifera]
MYSPNEHPTTDPLAENNLQPFFVLHKASESTAMSPGKPRKRRLDSSPKVSLNNENMKENLKNGSFPLCVDVLRSINADVFDEIGQWVRESFNEICSCRGPLDPSNSTAPYPFVQNGGLVKKLFTALVFTKNIETVDDILTFSELGLSLKSHGCYVANISSLDFSTKNGIEGCLRAFLRQLLEIDIEEADFSLLASWYINHGKYEKPVVVIIEDMERCSGAVLSDFINMLRYCHMAIVQQLSIEPLSFVIKLLIDEGDNKRSCHEDLANFPEQLIKHAFELPSYRTYSVNRNNHVELNAMSLGQGLSELQRLQELWRSRLMCLHEAGRYHKVALLDLYVEALDPEIYNSRLSNDDCDSAKDKSLLSNNAKLFRLQKAEVTNQVICKIRDLPAAKLFQLLKIWERLTKETIEVHEKIVELQSQMVSEDVKSHKGELTDIPKRHINRHRSDMEKDACTSNDKAMTLAGQTIRDAMQPIECMPFHELICFRDVDNLQSALVGDPRRRIQIDLLNFDKILKCGCCSNSGGTLSPYMHDTSIMYTLAQEHGDLINLHDWFQSFKASISSSGKKGLKKLASPKKRKDNTYPQKVLMHSFSILFYLFSIFLIFRTGAIIMWYIGLLLSTNNLIGCSS